MSVLEHLFVVPDYTASISGGNRFNAGLIESLRERGVRCETTFAARDSAADELVSLIGDVRSPKTLWLDSIYFERFDGWLEHTKAVRLGALLHSLPSQLRAAANADVIVASPGAAEVATLSRFDMVMATSVLMATQLQDCACRAFVVEPARPTHAVVRSLSAKRRALRACIVSHLLANKRVDEFLVALAEHTPTSDWRLDIIGRSDIEPEVANTCRQIVDASPHLASHVHFLGGMAHAETLDIVARSDLFVSTSPFESYGMAIADARALGVPVLAREGGNVAALVSSESGGELCGDAAQLARSFVALASDPARLPRRGELALEMRLPGRSWQDVAEDFLRGMDLVGR